MAGLGSGFGYALYSIFSRIALRKYSWVTVLFYTFFFATIVGIVAFNEAITIFNVGGVLLIIISLIVLNMKSKAIVKCESQ